MSCVKKIYSLILIFCTGTLCENANADCEKGENFEHTHIGQSEAFRGYKPPMRGDEKPSLF